MPQERSPLPALAALVVLAAGCSSSREDSREACLATYPALAPCRAFVAESIRAERRDELFAALAELRRAHPQDWTAAYLTGYAHYVAGASDDAPPAIASFEEAERLAAAAGAPAGRAEALLMQGAVEEFRDDRVEPALELYLRAVEQADAAGDVDLYVQCAWAVATLYPELGRYADQIAWLERGLARFGEQGDPANRRALLYELGNAHRKLGDWISARRWLERDLESALADGDALDEALALQMLGNVEMDRDPAASLPWFERCAARAAEARLAPLAAHCEVLIGVALVQSDRVAEGRRRLEATLDRSQRLAEEDIEQTVQGLSNLLYLAEALRRLDEPERALELYRRARARSAEWRKPYFEWQVTAGLAALHLSQRRYDDALAEARRGVEQVESLRRSIEDEAQRVYYLRQRSNVYAVLASALDRRYGAASAGEVLEALERVHSRTLRESLDARSDAGADGRSDSASLEAIQRSLLPRDVLVEYLLGEDESLLLVVTPHAARLHRLPPRGRIEDLVERYRRVLKRPLVSLDARVDPEGDFSRTASPGRELFEILLGPAAAELARSDRLIVVPDKQLHRLPFEALPDGDGFVGAGAHAVLYLPAASLLVERGATTAARRVVVLAAGAADPALGLAELSEISTEVERIRRAHDPRTLRVLEGPAATYERLRHALEGPVRTLHIAGHAISDPSSGPRIVLAGRLLSVAEILDLAPTPPLVVLSACETGEGELVGGEGILGLVRAFRLSGSTQTVASLWKADDSAAAELMGNFHAGLERGDPPSRALARARRELLARGFVHPFAWAAFVLYGAD